MFFASSIFSYWSSSVLVPHPDFCHLFDMTFGIPLDSDTLGHIFGASVELLLQDSGPQFPIRRWEYAYSLFSTSAFNHWLINFSCYRFYLCFLLPLHQPQFTIPSTTCLTAEKAFIHETPPVHPTLFLPFLFIKQLSLQPPYVFTSLYLFYEKAA